MTDWSKLKVAELKEECKARNIPLTGLKLKQQYIDKLAEHEAATSAAATPDERTPQEIEHPFGYVDENAGTVNGEVSTAAEQHDALEKEDAKGEEQDETGSGEQSVDFEPVEEEESLIEAEPTETATQNAQASNDEPKPEGAAPKQPVPATAQPEPQPPAEDEKGSQPKPEPLPVPLNPGVPSTAFTPASMQIHPAELAEDHRKRKRRSPSPAPTSQEVALKKARANDGTPIVTEREPGTLEKVQQATNAAQAKREADGLPNDGSEPTVKPLEPAEPVSSGPLDAPTASIPPPAPPATEEPAKEDTEPKRNRSISIKRSVAPALHPPTSSLFIRNFKRPLHIPTLKEHLVKLARSRSDPDSEPVKTFYLDSIRTHAFISFTSTSAASRVRAEMHETRFPDEPQREPLFVDYIPEEKVQEWIDQETGGGFGRGGNNRRYEVVYNEGPNGVEARLQDADMSKQRPSIPQQRVSVANAPKGPAAGGVHPDRAAFVPREERKLSYPERPAKRDAGETGFKALDELFSFTAAKPKLYYKPVQPEVVDDRLDMIKGLRVGHPDMGRSGDEGMKRYTFEKYKGREDWVDKGPEFGHGQRGQAILRGDRGRGRGGSRGGRGDSWRGR